MYMYVYLYVQQCLTQQLCHFAFFISSFPSLLLDCLLNSPPTKSLPFVLPLSLFFFGCSLYCCHTYVFKNPYWSMLLLHLKKPVLTFHRLQDKVQIHKRLQTVSNLRFPITAAIPSYFLFPIFLFFMCLSQCLEFLFFVIQETEKMIHHPLQGQLLIISRHFPVNCYLSQSD